MNRIVSPLALALIISMNATAQIAVFEFSGTSSGDGQFNEVTLQPENGLFGPFLRQNVDWATGANVFSSKNWTVGMSLDLDEYVGFSIASNPGYQLDLTELSFNNSRSSTGPANGQVSLFLNNAPTATESFSFSPGTSFSNLTFDFADVTGAESAEFRFYGFGASSAAGTFRFDDVSTFGSITPVPEPSEYGLVAAVVMLIYAGYRKKVLSRQNLQTVPASQDKGE